MQICLQIWLLEKQQSSQLPFRDIPLQTLWMAKRTLTFERIVALIQWNKKDPGGRLTWKPFTKSDRLSSKTEETVVVSSCVVVNLLLLRYRHNI